LSDCLVLFSAKERVVAAFEFSWAEFQACAIIGPHAGFWAQAVSNRKKAGRGMCVDIEMISGTWSEINRVSNDTAEFGNVWFQMVLMNTLSMR
jgi:hypothetical protein